MASKYIQKFAVPEAFPDIISSFTTEVLRNQPLDIIDFGIEYFRCLQEGAILDYHSRGNNLPCDFKPSIPQVCKKKEEKHVNPIEDSQEIPQYISKEELSGNNTPLEPNEEQKNDVSLKEDKDVINTQQKHIDNENEEQVNHLEEENEGEQAEQEDNEEEKYQPNNEEEYEQEQEEEQKEQQEQGDEEQ